MYIFVTAVLRERTPNSQYKEVDIRQLRFDEVLSKYVDGFIELEHTMMNFPFYVPLNDLRSMELPYGNHNFETWLGQITDVALPTYNNRPTYPVKKVIAADAALAGFKMNRVMPVTLAGGPNYTPGMKTDILMTKDGFNGEDMRGKFLVTVNGMCHNTGYAREGLVVFGGASTLDVSGTTTVGVISFESIGDIKTVYLGEGKVIGDRLRSEMILNLGESVVGKSVMLSIGGYLHVCDDAYTVIDDAKGIVRIDTPKIDIARRIMRSQTRMDMSALGLSHFEFTDSGVIYNEVLTNLILRRYMQLPQSFAIIVDTPHLYKRRIPLLQLPMAGYTEYHQEPTLPLVDDYGHLLEYWKGGRGDDWALISDPRNYLKHQLYQSGATESDQFIVDVASPQNYDYMNYALLEIGSQKVEFPE